MTSKSRAIKQARDAQTIAGIQKDLSTATALPLGGETYNAATLQALIERRIDAANAVATTRATWLAAVEAYAKVDETVSVAVRGLEQYVVNAYGPTSPKLADFGFTPSKRATQTPEQKAAAVAKRAATRKARGTMGKNQKKAVKGDVTGVVVTPVTSAPAAPLPAPPASPASAPNPVPTGASPQAPAANPPR